ncbi:hypothetical protein VHEMI08234 [[Torrubiella] hemipterigena]|uniref:6-phosphogluconate dehydrogenase family protein n=1 Tax=[Torrubiella] hemipterigena TaxID=1531966 RepID=A0A0A1TPC7_9HYPO|nr:hypothetical protein VHEMI08234 [[Torrubiella] hemipterigena]
MSAPRVGWIGLGSMGQGMAINVQHHLRSTASDSLLCFNRSVARCEPVVEAGAKCAESAQDVLINSDIVFISLSDDVATKATVEAMLSGLAPSAAVKKLIVDTSTVHPDTSAWMQTSFSKHGAQFLAAPVFGASPVAANGQLLFVLAGPPDAVKTIEPYLEGVMARAVIYLGEDVTLSSKLKTVGNFITAGMMELLSETHVLAEKVGLSEAAVENLIDLQYKALPLAVSQRITGGHYLPVRAERPWSDLNLAVKDVGLVVDCAKNAGVTLPTAETIMGNYKTAQKYSEEHDRPLDSSSMYGVLREQAGLPFESAVVKKRDDEA